MHKQKTFATQYFILKARGIKKHIKPLLQIPIIFFLGLLHGVYANAQTDQLGFDPNVFQIVVTPDSDLIGWYDAQKYGEDLSIATVNDPGVYACSTFCPQAALDAGAVYYKQFQIPGHGTVTVYYDANGNIIGTGRDLDSDGIDDGFDIDTDGDGINDTYDAYAFDPARSSNQVGAVMGQLSVNPGGAATYIIPIAVPAGTAGVQPHLSLNYNSQSGNNLLGVGWSLGGLSVISRCPATLAEDGYIDGVDLDGNDKFCLDGQRLVEVAGTGTYGANGTEYRTRMDGFSRIISYGTAGNGPDSFKVWTKAGDIMEYGFSADAKAKVPGKNDVLTWALNKVTDSYGNYFALYYIVNNSTGEQYPDRIEYTGNTATGLSPYNTLTFTYTNRSDLVTRYVAGAILTMSKRLTQISTPAFNYILNYRQTGLAQRNQLVSVLQCDKNNGCLPPIRFDWISLNSGLQQDGGYTNSLPNTYLSQKDGDQTEGRGVQLQDIDGDGLLDIFQSYLNNAGTVATKAVYLNDGSQFIYNASYSGSLGSIPFFISQQDGEDGGGRLLDINGDGLIDLVKTGMATTPGNCDRQIKVYDEQTHQYELVWIPQGCTPPATSAPKLMVYINNGNGWGYNNAYDVPDLRITLDDKDGGVRFGDVNGDGLTDVVRLWHPHIDFYNGAAKRDIYLNTGSGFSRSQSFSDSLSAINIYFAARQDGQHHDLGTRIADINGDGMGDLIQIFNSAYSGFYSGGYVKRVYLSTGTQFIHDADYSYNLPNTDFAAGSKRKKTSYSDTNSTVNRGTELVDLNNDGLLDLIQSWDVNNTEKHHSAYLNTGKQFQMNAGYTPPDDMPFRINIEGQRGMTKSGGTLFTDINNDGLIDLVRMARFRTVYSVLDGYDSQGDPVYRQIAVPHVHRYVYLNNGSGFESERSTAYENEFPPDFYFVDEYGVGSEQGDVDTGAQFADINGDASNDLITIYHDGSAAQKAVYLNRSTEAINLISKITGSFGDESTISYGSLIDDNIYTKAAVNTTLNRKTNPELDLQTTMRVVKRISNTNGIGGTVSSAYHYGGLKADLQSRSNLGFKTVTVIDEQSGVSIQTEYAQHPDYAGMALRLTKRNTNGQLMSDAFNTPEALATDGNGSLFSYVAQSVEKTYDLDNQQLLKTETTTTTYGGTENGGNYGNFTTMTVHTVNETNAAESFTISTENRYLPPVKTANEWILGRLYWSKSTRLKNGQSDANSVRTSSFEYNSNGILKSETILPDDPQEVLTTLKQYDAYGNVIKQTSCDTVATHCAHDAGNFRTSTTEYDSQGRFPVQASNALGQSEDRSYDHVFGNINSMTGPNQLTTHWYYDSFGRRIREARADGTETAISRLYCGAGCPNVNGVNAYYQVTTSSTASAPVTEYYDRHQRKIRVQTTGYSGQTLYTDTVYDNRGRVEKTSMPYAIGETLLWTISSYDNYSRVIAVNYPIGDINGDGNDDGQRNRLYTYNGYSKTETDAKNRSTTQLNNAAGEKIKIIDAGGNTIQYEYNSQGNLVKTIDPNGNAINISYDDRGLKTAVTDPDMGTWTYNYNHYGELINQTDAKGQTTSITYDKLGRMVSRTEAEGTSTWIYGNVFNASNRSIGKLVQSTGPQGNEIKTYTYDSLGRPVSSTQTLNIAPYINSQSYTSSQSYDIASGRIDTLTYPQVGNQQLQIKQIYNNDGYLTEVKSADGSTSFWQGTDSNARGQITQVLLGNGLISNYDYNRATGWMLGVTTTDSGGSAIQHSSYTFDDVGNILTRSDHHQQVNGLVETFSYDSLFDRLSSTSIQNNIDPNIAYTNKSYAYDSLGNITSKDGKAYRYGSQCQVGYGPHAVCEVVNGGNTDIYTYDANGNMTTGGGRTVEYTSFNKPNKFIKGSETVHFHYGAERSRIFKVANTTRTTYIGLGGEGNPLYEKNENTAIGQIEHLHFIYAAGSQAVAVHKIQDNGSALSSNTEYYHRDHLGSIEAISTDTASVTYLSYDPWGKRRNPDWSDANATLVPVSGNLGYTGHESIPEIGLIHMNGRVYDPDLGRFLSADPHIQFSADLQSYNRYSYVLNNPLKYSDPSGYWVQFLAMVIMAAAEVHAIYIAMVVAALAMLETYYHTGNARAAIQVGIVTFVSAQISNGIGEWGGSASYASNPSRFFAKAVMHGINGGMTSVALGGDFRSGATGGFAATLGEPIMFGAVGKSDTSGSAKASRTILAAMVGGTVSELSGGKFKNGALSAAMKWLFNTEENNDREQAALDDAGGQCFLTACSSSSGTGVTSTAFTIGKKNFNVIGGTATDRTNIQTDLAAIFSTSHGAKMLATLEGRKFLWIFNTTFTIDLTVKNNAYTYAFGNTVYVDPGFHPVIQTTAGPIPATTQRILAHELGHAVNGNTDSGPARMINTRLNENPIMNALGQPSRTVY